MKRIALLFVAMAALASCNVFRVNRTSYVQGYTEYGSAISLEKSAEGVIYASVQRAGRLATIESVGEDGAWFESLCAQYGDVSYQSKQNVGLRGQYVFIPQCITPDIASIDVCANVDLGAGYPAGSSLADCMRIQFSSCYAYVSSGYKDESSNWKEMDLNLLTREDLMQMEYGEILFRLTFKPSISLPEGPWILTVSCEDANGRHLYGTLTF